MRGLHHFFTPPALLRPDEVRLAGDEARHAARVLRLRIGERITVADGTGRVAEAEVTAAAAGEVVGRVARIEIASRVPPRIVLYQALLKGDRMDAAIEKAAELGVERVVPFQAARSVARWDPAKRSRAHARWQSVALGSAKQSRSPFVAETCELLNGLPEPAEEVVLLLDEGAQIGLRSALAPDTPESVGVICGPEGGFDASESKQFTEVGARACTLGAQILRADTAATLAVALVSFSYGRLG